MMRPILDADLPIVDPHHHLGFRAAPYELPDLLGDVTSGHNILATVFVECMARYRDTGPEEFRPVGETDFVIETMRTAPAEWRDRLCAGIVAFADLRLDARTEAVLDAQMEAAEGRLRGIRQLLIHDPDPFFAAPYLAPADLMEDSGFRRGIAAVGRRGLVFDAMIYHPQAPRLIALAGACPDTIFVVDHLGSPICTGPYANRKEEERSRWLGSMRELAALPNIRMKLGGLGMRRHGTHLAENASESEIAAEWREFILPTIDLFGPDRCMFESNFPVDRQTCSYAVLWNVFKTVAAGFGPAERARMFADTAIETYALRIPRAAV